MIALRILSALGALAATVAPSTVANDNWVVVRLPTGGVCVLVKEVDRPMNGRLLVTAPNELQACRAAVPLKANEDMTSDQDHCFEYTIAMISECKGEGVVLPQ